MKKYRITFQFFNTEAEARSFCDAENKSGNAYKRKTYPATVTPWKSKSGSERRYLVLYYY